MDADPVIPVPEPQSPAPRPFPFNGDAGRHAANAGKPLYELKGDTSGILRRLADGERAAEIAKEFCVSQAALYAWLLRNSPEEWQAISAGRALQRYEKAKTDLDDANDQVTISRARESARLSQWDLERAARRLYGENKDTTGVVVNVFLDQSCGGSVVIDAEPERDE